MQKYFLVILLIVITLNAQDSTKSLAIKPTKIYFYRPLVQPVNGGYPLLAAYLLVKNAKEGDPFSQHELGVRYLLNEGFPADTAQAAYWIKKAADQNLPGAKMNYGIMVNNGIGVDWNPFIAYEHFKAAAYNGIGGAQFAYGIFLIDNMVVSRNLSEAYAWIKKAANQKVEGASEVLKNLEKKGISAPDSTVSKIDKLVKPNITTAENDYVMAQDFELDYFDFDPDSSIKKPEKLFSELDSLSTNELKDLLGIERTVESDTSVISLIKLAAKNGSPEALNLLARAYEKGEYVQQDEILSMVNYIRAYRLGSFNSVDRILKFIKKENFFVNLKKAIDQGNSDAMYVWAGLVAMGFDYQISGEQAFELLLKAVAQNNVFALVEAGLCYQSGTLVKEDKAKAKEYWGKAAELGSREALVRMSFSNIFSEVDFAVQRNNFNIILKAAEEGSVLAQTYLAYCYETGKGTKVDKASAVRYYRIASQRGNETAYESLKRMHDELRPAGNEYKIL